MNFSIRNVQQGSRRRGVGHSEAIPRWSVSSRAALGVLAVLALLIPIALVAALVTMSEVDSWVLVAGFGMLVFHGILVLLFISFVGQNLRIDGQRPLWIAGLLLAAPITLPLYWWKHIWNAPFVGDHAVDDEVPARVLGDQT